MSWSELSVRRGVTFTMLYLALVGAGVYGLSQLRMDMYPDITFPLVGVVASYTGASPEDIEEVVTRPIEEAVASVENVKYVNSQSKDGASVVMVELNWGTDTDKAERDIRKNLDLAERFLPPDLDRPITFAFDPSMQPVMLLAVSGPFSQAELREISEHDIEPLLERIEGVASAETAGGLKREIQVRLSPERMEDYGISAVAVANALRANNVTIPGGEVVQGGIEFMVQSQGQFDTVEEIREVVVGVKDRAPVKLRMVAEVVDSFQEQKRFIRHNGNPGILLVVRKQSDANSVQVCNRLEEGLPEILKVLPKGLELSPFFNQSDFIEQSIGNLSNTALMAFVLAFIVLLFFLCNFRAALVVATAIPVSVIATFLVMHAVGITLNIISMAGLALAVGMLVDNSIVVLENIFRHLESGMAPREAAVKGAREVSLAITASTLTTIAVFAPVLFVPGIAGLMFRDMAITICFSLATSLAIALTLVPLLASRLVRLKDSGRPGVLAACNRFAQGLVGGLQRFYGRRLKWSLSHRVWTLVIAFGLLVVSLGLTGPFLHLDFFAKQDSSLSMFQADAMVGSSVETTDSFFKEMEKIAVETPEVTDVISDIGSAEGFVAMFSKGSYSGVLRLKLRPLLERREKGMRRQEEVEQYLRNRFREVAGIRAYSSMFFSFGDMNTVETEIYGDDLTRAQEIGLDLKRRIEKIPNAADVTFSLEESKPELGIYFDRQRLSALGLSTAQVSQTVSTYFKGTTAGRFRENGREYDILVRAPRDFRESKANLENVALVTPLGQAVPLKNVASVERRMGPVEVTRKNQQRKTTVASTVVGPNMGQVVADIGRAIEETKKVEDTSGFTFKVGGAAEDFQESFMWLGIALVAAILLVYMVMASQFESLVSPFIIFFSIPLAAIGVVWILVITRTSVSVAAMIGGIMLVGVVVNNAIVMVDYINQLRAQGQKVAQACYDGGLVRMRPVLMTAMTTILAMFPLALGVGEGAEGWAPMARVAIGGLLVSTLLTLLVIPTIYRMVEGWRERRRLAKESHSP